MLDIPPPSDDLLPCSLLGEDDCDIILKEYEGEEQYLEDLDYTRV